MTNTKLDKEEQQLLDKIESGQYESVLTEARKKQLQAVAGHTFKKDKRINIRISNRDLTAIQSKAYQEGIPYQTLVSSILHKYISGSMQDISAVQVSKKPQHER
ncbi:MAG: hypothetical protein KZQ58_00950 [gamma proteobacterium symbiont of Bathyaustriella thionipta]|nr:hypothetical protein [gamma proteobacterium symbiont of Bathyaustriella thionipta]